MKKNVASQIIGAQLVNATTGAAFTGSVTVYVTGDGGTQAAGSVGAGACTHEGNGFHTYAPAQAETNYDHIGFTFIGTGAVPATIQVYPTFPQTGDNFARLGAPAGASVSADIAAAKVDTAAIKVKTDYLPSATAGAAGGLFIAGSNAATSVTTAFTANITGNLSGSVGSVTGAVGSVTGAVGSVTARVTANTDQLAGQTVTAAAGVTFPTSVASTTNITAGTITTVTNLTNAATAGDFTATMKTSIGTAVAASAVASVTGNVGGNVTGSVGSVTGLTNSTIADQVWDEVLSGHAGVGSTGAALSAAGGSGDPWSTALPGAYGAGTAGNIVGSYIDAAVSSRLSTAGYTAPPAAAAVADAVWDEVLSGHLTAGTTGNALNAAGAAGDPWTTSLPGAYGAGSAGYIIGTNIDALISSRMATYTQPTGFLAATFPGTVASTTNITAGTISTVTTLTNLPSIPANWLTAAGIAAGALDGKGNWNIGKTGYSLTTAPLDAAGVRGAVGLAAADLDTQLAALPTAAEVRAEMDSNSTKLASIETRGDNVVCRGTVSATSPTTTSFTASAMSPSGAAADQFKGRIIIFDKTTTTAALRGQATDITANTSASLPVFTFTALTTAPVSGDTFSVT